MQVSLLQVGHIDEVLDVFEDQILVLCPRLHSLCLIDDLMTHCRRLILNRIHGELLVSRARCLLTSLFLCKPGNILFFRIVTPVVAKLPS